jgi:hypothetical protein
LTDFGCQAGEAARSQILLEGSGHRVFYVCQEVLKDLRHSLVSAPWRADQSELATLMEALNPNFAQFATRKLM